MGKEEKENDKGSRVNWVAQIVCHTRKGFQQLEVAASRQVVHVDARPRHNLLRLGSIQCQFPWSKLNGGSSDKDPRRVTHERAAEPFAKERQNEEKERTSLLFAD